MGQVNNLFHHHRANSWKLTTIPSQQSLISLVTGAVFPTCSVFSPSPPKTIVFRLILRYTKWTIRSISLLNLFCNFWWWLRHWSGVRLCNSLERRLKTTDLRLASSELKSLQYLERKCRYMRFYQRDQLPCATLLPSIGIDIFLYSLRSGQQSSRQLEELSLLTIFRRVRLPRAFPVFLVVSFGSATSPSAHCIQYNTNKMMRGGWDVCKLDKGGSVGW